MKISKYVTKYDYIAYYTKQPAMWFFTNAEIEAALAYQYWEINHQDMTQDDDLEDEEEEFEEHESDSYLIFKTAKDDENNSVHEIQNPKYLEFLNQTKNTDDTNPLLVEGRIIDQKSKEYIKEYFCDPKQNLLGVDYFVFDFDDYRMNLEQASQQTIKLLSDHENIIIFQPSFIDHDLQIATKCDALVKTGYQINIIETKATSSAKIHHFLDLFFQKKIVEKVMGTLEYEFNYFLCLIRYEKLDKKQVSFIISDTMNLTKSVTCLKDSDVETKQLFKLGDARISVSEKTKKETEIPALYINNVLNANFQDNPEFFKAKKVKARMLIEDTVLEFHKVIKELWAHKSQMQPSDIPPSFVPSPQDKSAFKNTDQWPMLRKLYAAKGFQVFGFSGNVMEFKPEYLETVQEQGTASNMVLEQFLKGQSTGLNEVLKLRFLMPTTAEIRINPDTYQALVTKLKSKKVYFDFESINPSIRAVDHSLPFLQAITQNSVIKDYGEGIDNQNCLNLVRDPNCIDLPWFKQIIDSLYEGEDFSYIVYNKNFESCRLREMANFINEQEYLNKVTVINNNMFDLADFFMSKKDKWVILFKELGGFYSIKKVLPLVAKYAPYIFEQTKCKNYNDLVVGNGLVCQHKTLARFYGQLNDEDWAELVKNVSIYCENDVRAMVAVEYFITQYLAPKYL